MTEEDHPIALIGDAQKTEDKTKGAKSVVTRE